MSKYSMSDDGNTDDNDVDDVHNRAVKNLDKIRRLDENNPMERAIKFDKVKKNPPAPGFMKVDCYEGETKDNETCIVSESRDKNGGLLKRLFHPSIFSIDLNTLITADVAACPSNIMPMLIDKHVHVALVEKKARQPDKVEKHFNWWWIVFFLLMIPGIITVILLFI